MEIQPQRNIGRPAWATKRFLKEYGELTAEQKRRTRKAFVLWRIGVLPRGLHCEKCRAADGSAFWTLRGTYKIRIFFVDRGENVVFFAVNFHDYDITLDLDFDAIAPAESLSKWDPEPNEEDEARETADEDFGKDDDPDLLTAEYPLSSETDVSNQALLNLGVLWEHIPEVRSLANGDELLDLLERHPGALPERELMAIFDEPRKSTVEKLLRERRLAGKPVAGEDVDGGQPQELDYWRAASLERFRRWFSPSQWETVIARSQGPMVVLGAAGTGKTVVALHRAHYLARAVFDKPEDRILLTTFSRTLTQDLERQLDEICDGDSDVRDRIDVKNIDDAMVSFLNTNGFDVQMDFVKFNDKAEALMEKTAEAVGYSGGRDAEWLWKEYSTAIEGFGIRRSSDYIGHKLPGPDPKPDDAEKKKLWAMFRRFDAIAGAEGFWTPGRAANLAIQILKPEGGAKPESRYAAAVVDETQDMSRERLRFLAAVVGYNPDAPKPDILTFFGDARQRIFEHGASLCSSGIKVCAEKTLGRNYRSTEAIRLRAEKFLEGVPMDDLDGDLIVRDPSPAARKGVPVEEVRCEDVAAEGALIAETIRRWIAEDSKQPGSPARRPGEYAVFAPTNARVRLLHAELEKNGMPALVVTAAKAPVAPDRVRVMTLHRAKGLEFQGVVLDLDNDNWPMSPRKAARLAPKERQRRVNEAKCLAYVGMTRAIRRAMLTGVGAAPEEM